MNDVVFHLDNGRSPVTVPPALANRPTLERLLRFHDAPLEHLPAHGRVRDDDVRAAGRETVAEQDIELVVPGHQMQIISPRLCAELAGRCIFIRHPFLRGFTRTNQHGQAHAGIVSPIGADTQFVTSDQDNGFSSFEQEIRRLGHTSSPQELVVIARDIDASSPRHAVAWLTRLSVLLDAT